ncbi:MAG: SDR family NAD(P)-dependent oxidoreductase, partial [Rhodomicrobium sp.]
MAQLALITGAAVRIGKAIALHLARSGFSVAIQYRSSKEEAAATVAAIQELGVESACFQVGLAEHAEVEALFPAVNRAMGPVTCLINNASSFADDRIQSMTEEGWDKHMAINLKAPVFLAQAFAAQLSGRETGNIINIIDQRV